MTHATRNKAQGAALRKAPARHHPWRAWAPGSLTRSSYLPEAEHQYNPNTRRMERVK